jgi:hypothetical protein
MRTHLLSATLGKTAAIVLAMTAFSVEAATNLNSSRSGIYRAVTGAWDDAACLEAGGTLGEQDGLKLCFLPAAAAINLNSSKSNIYRAIGGAGEEASCLNAGGIVIILDGRKRCYPSAAITQ